MPQKPKKTIHGDNPYDEDRDGGCCCTGGEKKKDKWIMPDPESFDVKNDPEAIEQDEYKIVAEI